MDQNKETAKVYFYYTPDSTFALVGLAVFALFSIFLFIRIYKSKSRRFLYILPITALMESIGYLLRYMCATGETNLMKYVGMTFFLLLPPNALALVNYKALGEIVRLSQVQGAMFFLRPKFITWFFFASDIFAFLLQGSGGGLQVSGDNAALGKNIALIGLSVQLGFFACFAFITIYVHRSSKYNYQIEGQANAKKLMVRCLYITLFFLYVRSIYRVAEYATGRDGPVASSEWAFYVFDGLAIALSFVSYCVYFMGDYIPKRNAAKFSSLASSDPLNYTKNDMEMGRNNNRKYARGNFK